MRAKVVVRFYDKEANKIRNVGETFKITPTRFTEIISKGKLIEPCRETAKAEDEAKE